MSSRNPLGLALVAGFAVVIVMIGVLATRGDGDDNAPRAEAELFDGQCDAWEDIAIDLEEASFLSPRATVDLDEDAPGPNPNPTVTLANRLRYSNWDPLNPDFQQLSDTEVEQRIRQDKLDLVRCLAPGEVVVVVEGLPAVSHLYRSAAGNLAVSGFGATAGPDPDIVSDVGRCYVNSNGAAFQTKVVETLAGSISPRGGDEAIAQFITVDVGITLSGSPFAAVVRQQGQVSDAGAGSPTLALMGVTHNYEPAEYRSNAIINVDTPAAPPGSPEFHGVAVFSSTSYNNREYSPYTDFEWPGSPKYNFTITVLCG